MNKSEETPITIGRKKGSNACFLTQNGEKISDEFENKLGGFSVIMKKFLQKEISFKDFENLFKTIESSKLIPIMHFHAFRDGDEIMEEINKLNTHINLTHELFGNITRIIFQINHAMNGDVFPRVIDCGGLAYIQVKKISELIITTEKVGTEQIETAENGMATVDIHSMNINMGRGPEFDNKNAGVLQVAELFLRKEITKEDEKRLIQEISRLSIPINKKLKPRSSKEFQN